MREYKIIVRTLSNHILTFTVESYTISKGGFVEFTDRVTGKKKRFHASNCEIAGGENGR